MRSVTCALRLIAIAILVGVLADTSSATSRYTPRYVAFVAVAGHGTVRSVPRGLSCPRTCRASYVRGTHLRLIATPAPGWKLAGFDGEFCHGARCAFDLVSSHDCVGGACPIGAFGVRVAFTRST